MRRITVGGDLAILGNLALDGPLNVSNAGIVHMGSRGPGTDPACGTSRAHMTYGKEQFRGLSNKCARCEEKLAKWDRMKAAREGDNAGFMEGVLITGWPSGLVQVTQTQDGIRVRPEGTMATININVRRRSGDRRSKDANSPAYEKALAEFRVVSAAFREAQRAYRAKEIGDREFLAAKAKFDAASKKVDEAERA